MSPVRNPWFNVSVTAASILFAAFSSPRPYRNSIAALRIVANGLALSCTQHITGGKANSDKNNLNPPSVREHFEIEVISTCPAISGAEP